jgi:hypothetical protein
VARSYSGGARLPIYLHHVNYYKIIWIYALMAKLRARRSS